jgi:replicative DNA helicase
MAKTKNDLAEKAVISSLISNPEVVGDISDLLAPNEFFEPKNELIYSTIVKLYSQGQDFSIVSIYGALEREGNLLKAGGIPYLQELVDPNELSTMGSDPLGFALLVKEAARKRELSDAADTIKDVAEVQDNLSADEATQLAESAILKIVNGDAASDSMFLVTELLPEVIQDIKDAADRPDDAPSGIPSGFPDLDQKTFGFHPGQMIIIAARPAVGKSTLAVDFARNAAFLAGKTVLFFSLEMSAKELVNRILSAEARVETEKLKKGDLTEADWMNVREAQEKLKNGTFLIDSKPKTTLSRIRSIAMRQSLRPEGLDMICIDYLGLMEIPSSGRKNDSRQNDVSELSRGIKLLAKELGVPVIVLSQLNRNSEDRADGKPKVSDLRESGSLEQDADMVILIHRPEAADSNIRPGEADLILGKHRGGATGIIPLTSMLEFSKFVPGQGQISRETEMLSDGESGVFATTDDEVPW